MMASLCRIHIASLYRHVAIRDLLCRGQGHGLGQRFVHKFVYALGTQFSHINRIAILSDGHIVRILELQIVRAKLGDQLFGAHAHHEPMHFVVVLRGGYTQFGGGSVNDHQLAA